MHFQENVCIFLKMHVCSSKCVHFHKTSFLNQGYLQVRFFFWKTIRSPQSNNWQPSKMTWSKNYKLKQNDWEVTPREVSNTGKTGCSTGNWERRPLRLRNHQTSIREVKKFWQNILEWEVNHNENAQWIKDQQELKDINQMGRKDIIVEELRVKIPKQPTGSHLDQTNFPTSGLSSSEASMNPWQEHTHK